MAKVGSYIHYNYHNYLKYGIGVRDGSPPESSDSLISTHKRALEAVLRQRSWVNKANIKNTLEYQLNFFFAPGSYSIDVGFNSEDANRIQKLVIDIVNQAASSLNLKSASINWNNLSATDGNVNLDGDIRNFKNMRKGMNSKNNRTTYESIVRRMEGLIQRRNELVNSMNEADIAFVDKVNQIEKEFGDLYQDILIKAQEAGYGYQRGLGFETYKGKTNQLKGLFTMNDKQQNFVAMIKEALDMTKQTTDTGIQGTLGEYIPAVSQYVLEQLGKKTLDELLSEFESNDGRSQIIDVVKGKAIGNEKSTHIAYNKNVVTSNTTQSGSLIQAQIGDVPLRVNATQDKVDVVLDLPGGKTINASMKNVNLNNGSIGILKGSSSLNLLQDYPDFANYYLNVSANEGRENWAVAPQSELQKAHEAAKLTIGLHALAGGVWGIQSDGSVSRSKTAEILVVNNVGSSRGYFKVYFISDILKRVEEQTELLKIEGWDNPRIYNNAWVGGQTGSNKTFKSAWDRTMKVLAQLHTEKINVSISPDALT